MPILLFIFLSFSSYESFALVNGAPLQKAKDIVRIRLTNGWVCSGTFIDPYTILTAAHCISQTKESDKLQIDKIESESDFIMDLEVKKLIPHPNYLEQTWPSHDIGIIKTSKNFEFEGQFHLSEKTKRYFKDALLMGCGRTSYENKKYIRTYGENSFLQISSVLFSLGDSQAGKSIIGRNVSVAPNDSGGPIVENMTNKIIGVMTTTTLKDSLKYGVPTLSTGTSVSTPANLEFIKSKMGE